jgi:thioredoxin-related protein
VAVLSLLALALAVALAIGAPAEAAPAAGGTTSPAATGTPASIRPDSLKWLPYDEATRLAASSGRHVLVFVYASWCGWCRRMDSTTYRDPRVLEDLGRHFVIARVNGESSLPVHYRGQATTEARMALEAFGARQYPTTVFLTSDQEVIISETGYLSPIEMHSMAGYVGDGSYERKLKAMKADPKGR